jgi:hypothetical protein
VDTIETRAHTRATYLTPTSSLSGSKITGTIANVAYVNADNTFSGNITFEGGIGVSGTSTFDDIATFNYLMTINRIHWNGDIATSIATTRELYPLSGLLLYKNSSSQVDTIETRANGRATYLTSTSSLAGSKITGAITTCTPGKLILDSEADNMAQLEQDVTTFDVSGNKSLYVLSGTNAQGGAAIDNITGGTNGRQITILYNTTVNDNQGGLLILPGGNIKMPTTGFQMYKYYTITLIYYGSYWQVVSVSANTH